MMTSETGELGGRWALRIPLMSGETTLKEAGLALDRQPGRISGAFGRLFLTNRRIIWCPFLPYASLFRIKRPFELDLSELKGCEVGTPDVWYGYPVVLETREGSFRVFIHSREVLWMKATRDTAKEWSRAIEGARQQGSD